jgi:hypothetical protein
VRQQREAASKIMQENVLSALEDGSVPLHRIALSAGVSRDTLNAYFANGSLTDRGRAAISTLGSEALTRAEEVGRRRQATLSKDLIDFGVSAAKSALVRQRKSASKLVDPDFLSAWSAGASVKNVAEMSRWNRTALNQVVRSEGTLTDHGEALRSLLSADQQAEFDQATERRKEALSGGSASRRSESGTSSQAPLNTTRVGQSSSQPLPQDDLLSHLLESTQSQGAGASQAAGHRFRTPSPSLFQGLTPYQQTTPSHATARTPGHHHTQAASEDVLSQRSSSEPQGRSVVSRRGADFSPRTSMRLEELSTPGALGARAERSSRGGGSLALGSLSRRSSPSGASAFEGMTPLLNLGTPGTPSSVPSRRQPSPRDNWMDPVSRVQQPSRRGGSLATSSTSGQSSHAPVSAQGFRLVARGLVEMPPDDMTTLTDLSNFSDIPVSSLRPLLSDSGNGFALTNLGKTYLEQTFGEEERDRIANLISSHSAKRSRKS